MPDLNALRAIWLPKPESKGFTLIELLVVITIIVVLLALLTPALDKAVHQAQLAVCGSHQRHLGTSMTQYASGNKRQYMYRYGRTPVDTRPNLLRIGGAPAWADDRPLLEQYANLDMLVCPLSAGIKLDKANNDKDPYIYTGIVLFAGWQYFGEKGMIRLGDRFSCPDGVTVPNATRSYSYNVVASDLDWGFTDGRQIGSSHPDLEGRMGLTRLYNEVPNGALPPVSVANAPHTVVSWQARQNADREHIDLNYLYDDGSVARMDAVKRFDERVKPVWLTSSQTYEYSFWIPPAH